jgi:hypothetical protein
MIKQKITMKTMHARDLNYNHSFKKFCMRKHLQIMKRAYQTLVVNLPMRENTITCQRTILPSVAPHSKSK